METAVANKAPCPSGKRKYLDADSARASAESRRHVWAEPLYAYKCRDCDYYHLTKIRPENFYDPRRTKAARGSGEEKATSQPQA